jgi:thiamine pyrophosphate-dependent acetolactate synthase large subunit-like protein
MSTCDLVIVMGTSLQVFPFAGLIDQVPKTIPIVLINRENPGIDRDCFLFLPGDIETIVQDILKDAQLIMNQIPSKAGKEQQQKQNMKKQEKMQSKVTTVTNKTNGNTTNNNNNNNNIKHQNNQVLKKNNKFEEQNSKTVVNNDTIRLQNNLKTNNKKTISPIQKESK